MERGNYFLYLGKDRGIPREVTFEIKFGSVLRVYHRSAHFEMRFCCLRSALGQAGRGLIWTSRDVTCQFLTHPFHRVSFSRSYGKNLSSPPLSGIILGPTWKGGLWLVSGLVWTLIQESTVSTEHWHQDNEMPARRLNHGIQNRETKIAFTCGGSKHGRWFSWRRLLRVFTFYSAWL